MKPRDETGRSIPSNVDYIDTWKAMEECVALGLTKSIGLSNFNSMQIQRIFDTSSIKPAVHQVIRSHSNLPNKYHATYSFYLITTNYFDNIPTTVNRSIN